MEKNYKNILTALKFYIPIKYWNKINHILVCHGRAICDAKRPKCSDCIVNNICRE